MRATDSGCVPEGRVFPTSVALVMTARKRSELQDYHKWMVWSIDFAHHCPLRSTQYNPSQPCSLIWQSSTCRSGLDVEIPRWPLLVLHPREKPVLFWVGQVFHHENLLRGTMSEDCSQDRGTSEIGTKEGTYIRLKANVTVALKFSEFGMQRSSCVMMFGIAFPWSQHATSTEPFHYMYRVVTTMQENLRMVTVIKNRNFVARNMPWQN